MEIAFIPPFLLRCMPLDQRHALNGCLSSVLILLAAPFTRYLPHVCLMRTLLHRPCPGCGITTSLRAFEQGHLRAAWQANPAGLLIAAGLLFQIAAAILVPFTGDLVRQRTRTLGTCLSRFSYSALFAVWLTRLI